MKNVNLNDILKLEVREKTDLFNSWNIDDRRAFLGKLSESEKKTFVSQIRRQAVAD